MSVDEPLDDSDLGNCNRCGKPADFIMEDPFLSEVYPEDGPYEFEPWCQDCYRERREDV